MVNDRKKTQGNRSFTYSSHHYSIFAELYNIKQK